MLYCWYGMHNLLSHHRDTNMSKRATKDGEIEVTADGGIIKKILSEGTGEIIPANVVAKVHYTGRLQNGKVFDSSVSRNAPFKFNIGAFGDRHG